MNIFLLIGVLVIEILHLTKVIDTLTATYYALLLASVCIALGLIVVPKKEES